MATHPEPHRLDGWKAIARYVGRDRTTAMRWAATRGLPVHRLPGGKRASVFAVGTELDAWLAGDVGDAEAARAAGLVRRRSVIVGALVLAGGAIGARYLSNARPAPEVEALIEQARVLRGQNSPETHNQAIGLAREAVRLAPRDPMTWGILGYSRAAAARWRREPESRRLRELATMDGQRALDLDAQSAHGELALATALPLMGRDNWLPRANGLKRALERAPADPDILLERAWTLRFTGHCSEAAATCARVDRSDRGPPLYNTWIRALWDSGRKDEMDRRLAEAVALYPSIRMLWSTRLEVLTFGGRPDEAIAAARDVQMWPSSVTRPEVDQMIDLAGAIRDGDMGRLDAIFAAFREGATRGVRAAIMSVRIATLMRRLDEAFAVLAAYYFGRGTTVGGDSGHGLFEPLSQRHTNFLFEPSLKALRSDARFERLTAELGLARFWQESRSPPDFRGKSR